MPRKKKGGSKSKKKDSSKSKKKRTTHKKTSSTKKRKTTGRRTPAHIEKALVENTVALQKVMTNISLKFESLSTQIARLLSLFEISAKALAEKEFSLEKTGKESKEISEKMDKLLEQNKVIARGLTLIHESNSPKSMGEPPHPPNMPPPQQNLQANPQNQSRPGSLNLQGYQKSIASTMPPRPLPPEQRTKNPERKPLERK